MSFVGVSSRYWISGFVIAVSAQFLSTTAGAQVNNASSPLVFSNGTSVSASTLYTQSNSGGLIDNPVQVTGTGGTLTGSSSVDFLSPFTGTGTLTLNSSDVTVFLGYTYDRSNNVATFPNGFTVISASELAFYDATAVVNGPFSVQGSFLLFGNVVLTSNTISSNSSDTITSVGGSNLTFVGSGANFNFNAAFGAATMANTSGTQNFGGPISGAVQRVAQGGTTIFTSSLSDGLNVYGGTATLKGASGAATSTSADVYLEGGTLILDNTAANNNARIKGPLLYVGGNLSLLGVNGGTTNQSLPAPALYGFNTISVTPGTGTGSSAILTFAGAPTASLSDPGCVDFQGLGSNSQVLLTGVSAGPLNPFATVNGTDFATYNTTSGVQAMSTSGRPSQVSAGTASSYVLGTGAQFALTASVAVDGVTMTTGTTLDLGGNTLTLGGWIQNGSAGTITDGNLTYNFPQSGIYFTTNADLVVQATITNTQSVFKNGTGTLTYTGANEFGNFTRYFVNAGTLALNASSPFASVQGADTFTVGECAGAAGSATLSLLGNNQFISTGGTGDSGDFVGVQVRPAGQYLLNGYNANQSFLDVDSGTVDIGSGTLTAGKIVANAVCAPGLIKNGVLNIVSTNESQGGGGSFNTSNVTYQDALDVSSQITSSGTITISGSGVVVFSNPANSFGNGTVGLNLTGGTLALQNNGAAGSTNQTIEFNSGALRADSTGTLTLTNPVTGIGVITSGSAMDFAGGYTQTSYGGSFSVANTLTINGYAISGGSNYASLVGPGTLILSGTASGSSTGTFTQDGGTLAFDSDTPLPPNMTLTYALGIIEAVNNAHSVANALTISDDITFAGSEPLTFSANTGNNIPGVTTRNIYLSGTGPVTINKLSSSGSTTLEVTGPGTLVLSGDPTGFLGTVVNSGSLRVNNMDATGAALGTITVQSQATLGGTGIAKGQTNILSGGILNPGNQLASAGTLTFNTGLSLASGAILNFDLGKTTGSDLVQVTGGTFSGPSTGTVTLNIGNTGDFNAGTYTLFSWTNTSTIKTTNFVLGTVPAGHGYALSIVSQSLVLTVTGNIQQAPQITNAALSNVIPVNVPFNFSYTATGIPTPTFSATPNTLPGGLSFSSAGAITGTPTVPGTYAGTIDATNGIGQDSTQNFLITVTDPAYAAWATQNGLSGISEAMTAVIAQDGLNNLYKYALGLTAVTNYNPGDPALPYVHIVNANTLALTFTGVASDVSYTVYATDDPALPIAQWTMLHSYPSGGTAPGTVTVLDNQLITATTQRFLKLQMTIP